MSGAQDVPHGMRCRMEPGNQRTFCTIEATNKVFVGVEIRVFYGQNDCSIVRAIGSCSADQPVASLDLATSRQVLGNLVEVALENRMVIVCRLHQVDLALEFADRVIAISNGRITLNKKTSDVSALELRGIYANPAGFDPYVSSEDVAVEAQALCA